MEEQKIDQKSQREMGLERKSSPLMPAVIAAVIAAALAGGITYAVQNKRSADSQNTLQAQVDSLKSQLAALPTATPLAVATATPTPTATPTATPDPTANWKVYTNTKMGFSFKYPTDWKVAVTTDETGGNSFNADLTPASGSQLYVIQALHILPAQDNKDISTQLAYLKSVNSGSSLTSLTSQYGIRYSEDSEKAGKSENADFATGKYIMSLFFHATAGNQTTDYAAGKAVYDEVVSTFAKL
ncbi:MAG: hypothetical protein WCO52_01520 [bacterium]